MKKLSIFLMAAFATLAYAADISGNWKGSADFGNGPIERTFSFKVEGKKLTGETVSQMMGKSAITEGVVDGDDISFTITGNLQGSDVKINYKGKARGDEITLSSDVNGQNIEWHLKKTP